MMPEQVMERREALKYFGLLVATAAGREFLAGWLPAAEGAEARTGHHSMPASTGVGANTSAPRFFNAGQMEAIAALTERIIPTDDQPGAKEAQVSRYIDFVVFSAAEHLPELQMEWTVGLALLDELSQQKYHHSFRTLAEADQEHLLLEMSQPERDPKSRHPGFQFYRLVKDMTVEGFYTSRIGLIDVLGYKGRDYLTEFPGCEHTEHYS